MLVVHLPVAGLGLVVVSALLMSLTRKHSDTSEIQMVMIRSAPKIELAPEPEVKPDLEPKVIAPLEHLPEPQIAAHGSALGRSIGRSRAGST